jgi:branched-chain amino acid transport system substrate-binding protein
MKKIFILFIVVRVLLMLFSKVSNFDKELELTIAVVAPISGESSSLGQSMVDGARLYVDEVNRSGGIDGKKVAP